MKTRNLKAEQTYREAWARFCATFDDEEREAEKRIMDKAQEEIADHAKDPRWIEFSKTLPGFKEYWDSAATLILRRFFTGI